MDALINYTVWPVLKIKTQPNADLPRAIGACRRKQRIAGCLPRDHVRRIKSVEVDEVRTETEHRHIQYVPELDRRPKNIALSYFERATQIEIENIVSRPVPGISLQISRRANGRLRESCCQGFRKGCPELPPNDITDVTGKVWPVGADIIQITIVPADRYVKGRAGPETKKGRQPQLTEPGRGVESA